MLPRRFASSSCAIVAAAALLACSKSDDERGSRGNTSTPPRANVETLASASAGPSVASPTEIGIGLPPASAVRRPMVDLPARNRPRTAESWSTLPWKAHEGNGFSVLFPGEPKETLFPQEDDRGAFRELRVDLASGQATFVLGTSDHSAEEVKDPDVFLDEHIDAPRHGLSDILVKRAVTLPGGHHGRVLVFRRHPAGSPRALRIYSRQYLVGHRLYALILSTYDEDGAPDEVARKFMESFKLDR